MIGLRRVLRLLPVVAFVLFVLGGSGLVTGLTSPDKSFSLPRVEIEAVLDADATMRVVERITYDFEGPFSYGTRPIPGGPYLFEDVTVTEDGQELSSVGAPYNLQWFFTAEDDQGALAIAYTVRYAASVGPDVAELYWKWVGEQHPGIDLVTATLTNAEEASIHGLDDFENVRLEPIVMMNSAGEKHQFHFQIRLLGNMVALDAFELKDGHPGGYQFQIIGNPKEGALDLLGRMVGKIRRALAARHIEEGRHGPEIIGQMVRGNIEWDDSEGGELSLVVVDGREYSWDDLGRMLMAFEGWQFRLEMLDRSEEA